MFNRLVGIDVAAWIPLRIRIWILPLIFLFFGTGKLGLAHFFYQGEQERKQQSLVTTGTVIDFVRSRKNNVCPLIEFVTVTGETKHFASNACNTTPIFNIGDKVPVNYLAGYNPNPQLDGSTEGAWKVVILFSLLWFYVGLRLGWSNWKKLRALRAAD